MHDGDVSSAPPGGHDGHDGELRPNAHRLHLRPTRRAYHTVGAWYVALAVSPDEIRIARKAAGVTQKDLAEALDVDVALVREWEKGDRFPTKAHCDAIAALAKNPPPKAKGRSPTPMELLADPGFFTLVRKLLAHRALRAEVEKLAGGYADPLDEP
jgi:DNA-binding transcriptional regulator YiaG